MKRILVLVLWLSFASFVAADAQIYRGPNSAKQAHKAAVRDQKRAAKNQRKLMKQYAKAQRQAAKTHRPKTQRQRQAKHRI
jgi:hypothetical protein